MTDRSCSPLIAGEIPVLEHSLNGVPVMHTSTTAHETPASAPAGKGTSSHAVAQDRVIGLRLIAASALGVGCLILAQLLQPGERSPFAAPSGPAAWIAVICGIVGIWLVPGRWLSALVVPTGAGPVAWMATRTGTPLAWYSLIGPAIHLCQGARVTVGGIVTATAAVTGAVCLGVAFGLLRRPADPRLRILLAAVAGGMCAQIAICVAMRLWTYGMNYAPIRHFSWLIVLGCALVTTIAMRSRPELPSIQTARQMLKIIVFLAVIAITAAALLATGSKWSPQQRMASAFSAEQVPTPAGVDLALQLTALGPEGPRLIQHASFTASDDTGRPVRLSRLLVGDAMADRRLLLVVVDATSRSQLCERADHASENGNPLKLNMREDSGLLVQAAIRPGWCAR